MNLSLGAASSLRVAFLAALLRAGETLPEEIYSWIRLRAERRSCLLYSYCYCFVLDSCWADDWLFD
jgi:hypothetical protein